MKQNVAGHHPRLPGSRQASVAFAAGNDAGDLIDAPQPPIRGELAEQVDLELAHGAVVPGHADQVTAGDPVAVTAGLDNVDPAMGHQLAQGLDVRGETVPVDEFAIGALPIVGREVAGLLEREEDPRTGGPRC
jgi:hypothetical protein